MLFVAYAGVSEKLLALAVYESQETLIFSSPSKPYEIVRIFPFSEDFLLLHCFVVYSVSLVLGSWTCDKTTGGRV